MIGSNPIGKLTQAIKGNNQQVAHTVNSKPDLGDPKISKTPVTLSATNPKQTLNLGDNRKGFAQGQADAIAGNRKTATLLDNKTQGAPASPTPKAPSAGAPTPNIPQPPNTTFKKPKLPGFKAPPRPKRL